MPSVPVTFARLIFFLPNWLFLTTTQAKENEKKIELKIDIHSSQ
jgi:hypothetical protein